MYKRLSISLLTLFLVVTTPPQLLGQTGANRRTTRVPVTLVLVDRLPAAEAPFIVSRRPDVDPHDVLLLRPDVTPDQLSEAIRTLIVARQAGGDTAATRATLRIRSPQAPRRQAREFPWAMRVLEDLRRTSRKEVARIGNVQSIVIWLPSQHTRPRR